MLIKLWAQFNAKKKNKVLHDLFGCMVKHFVDYMVVSKYGLDCVTMHQNEKIWMVIRERVHVHKTKKRCVLVPKTTN